MKMKTSNTRRELPQFVLDLIAVVPRAGEKELHNWLYRVALKLHPFRTENEIAEILQAAVIGCGRAMKPGEIEDAINNSKRHAWQPGKRASTQREPAWPAVNEEQRQAIIANGWAV